MHINVSACQLVFRPYASFSDFSIDVMQAFTKVPETSDYVVLPELCTLGLLTTFDDFEQLTIADYRRIVSFLPAYKAFFRELAAARQQIIIAGSTLEEENGKLYNTAFIFEPNGAIHTHRKTHIFPAEGTWATCEGDTLAIFDVGPVKFGIAICYEAEIPEIATAYAQQGAELLIVPSYTFTEYGFWRVRHCAHARAIENQLYVVHCPTVSPALGIIQPGYGQAAILSPCDTAWTTNGIVVESTEHEVVSATLSLEALAQNRIDGAATTVKDRARRADLYKRFTEN